MIGSWDLGEIYVDQNATGMLQDVTGARRDACTEGILADARLPADKRRVATIPQLLRIHRGNTQLIMPRIRNRHGTVPVTRTSLTLESRGHETDVGVSYQLSPHATVQIETHLFARNHRDHESDVEVMFRGALTGSYYLGP